MASHKTTNSSPWEDSCEVTGADRAQIICCIIVTTAISLIFVNSFFVFLTIFGDDCTARDSLRQQRNVQSGAPHSSDRDDHPQYMLPCTSDTLLQQNHVRHTFNIAALNVNHLIPKIDEIRILLSFSDSPHIICLSETFLSDSTPDEYISIADYTLYRRDRQNKAGGGLAIYVHNSVSVTEMQELQSKCIEGIWLRVQLQNMAKVIGFIYRPPSSDTQWTEEFTNILEKTQTLNTEMIIMGDFNIDLTQENHKTRKWKHLMNTFGLTQTVKEPTRVTKNSATLIDHVYTSSLNTVEEIDTSVAKITISDHFAVVVTLKKAKNTAKGRHNYIQYRNFKNFNENAFKLELATAAWDLINETEDPNVALEWLNKTMLNSLNRHAPIKTKRVRRQIKPKWFNADVRRAITRRNKIKKSSPLELKLAQKRTKNIIKQAKTQYYEDLIKEHKNDPANIWKIFREFQKPNSKCKHIQIVKDDKVISDPESVAEEFSTHFSNATSTYYFNPDTAINNETTSNTIHSSDGAFHIPPIDNMKVLQIIQTLNSKKATGFDGISAKLLKIAAPVIGNYITKICNKSIQSGIFPETWKHAKIQPIHKKGPKDKVENYRPISILSIVSKILERHVHDALSKYVEENELLTQSQSGFRKLHSCHTALTHMTNKWYKNINEGKLIGAVFLDLSKAFDLVPHDILLSKLLQFHCSNSSIRWFQSYLKNRKQTVVVDFKTSTSKLVKSGVPQGSILGPLLFKLFINDLPDSVYNSEADLYADDCTLTATGNSVAVLEIKLNKDLQNIASWCQANKMHINPSKSTCMILSTRQKRKTLLKNNLTLHINNEKLTNVQSHKLLGLVIDSNLTWKEHADHVLKKVNKNIFIFKKIKRFLAPNSRHLFCNAYILPHIDYCCNIWGHCPETHKLAINRILKRSARLALNATISTPSQELFSTLHWLKFENRVQYQTATLTYKALNNLAPSYLKNCLSYSANNSLRSNTNSNLQLPSVHIELFRQSFEYSAPKVWNIFNNQIKSASTLSSFKSKVYEYYL